MTTPFETYFIKALHDAKVQQIRDKYLKKGYYTRKNFALSKNLTADLLLRSKKSSQKNIVFEIAVLPTSPQKSEAIKKIAKEAKKQGWEFRLVTISKPVSRSIEIDWLDKVLFQYFLTKKQTLEVDIVGVKAKCIQSKTMDKGQKQELEMFAKAITMNRYDVKAFINEGENSHVEFKSEAVSNEEIAIVMIAFLNGQGGVILLGVEDDGTITGIEGSLDKKMNAINQIAHNRVKPAIIPILDSFIIENKAIISITVETGIQKPYYLTKNEKTLFYIRVGTTCRLASPEQIAVLYANHPSVHYDVSPVPTLLFKYLDERRIRHYFLDLKKLTEKYYKDKQNTLCLNTRLAIKLTDSLVATLAGGLLFGREPSHFIPSAGIRCAAFEGENKDYLVLDKKFIDVPILPYEHNGVIIEDGMIEQAIQFVDKNTRKRSIMQGIKRIDQSEYPLETLREVITNALIHRDYSLYGGQIQLLIFSDRLEMRSPGKLPNTLTIDMIKEGASYTRNPVLMKFAENYGYVEHLGMGIPEKIIKPILKLGYPEPEFIDNGYEFIVILRKKL